MLITSPPDFLIIGAAKSGTSWLASTLSSNPQIFVAPTEIHYFSRFFERKSPAWYAQRFSASEPSQIRGERSNSYLTDPRVPRRIWECLPNVRLIAILRNPIERAYSGYCMQLDRGKISGRVEEYLDPDAAKARPILENGRYHEQLSRFQEFFPRSRLHVALYDDIGTRPAELLGEISAFVGCPFAYAPEAAARRINQKKRAGMPRALRRMAWPLLRNERLRQSLMVRLKTTAVWGVATKVTSRELTYPALEQAQRLKLAAFYRDDIRRLSDLIGRDLSHWLNCESGLLPSGPVAVGQAGDPPGLDVGRGSR